MDNRFQGLVVFLIGLSILLVAYTIGQAETASAVTISGPQNIDVVGISAPTIILWVFGAILVIAGIIWGTIGDKIKLKIKWTG